MPGSQGETPVKIAPWLILVFAVVVWCAKSPNGMQESTGISRGDWPYYGHDPEGTRYSPLRQIDRKNVSRLKVAWVFHTGDISEGNDGRRRSGFENTPIMVDGTLYLSTAFNRVIALDPATGKQRWAYDPKTDLKFPYGDGLINRGVATWLDPGRSSGQPCHRRIFESTLDARLIALDAATGVPCRDFGANGQVSLQRVARYRPGWYHMTSPPTVIDNLVVVGSAIDDNVRADMPSGAVRAYDARSGALRWTWDPIPQNGSRGSGHQWLSGAANAWSIITADPQRGLVFVPTGSASPDFYGGDRPGDDKWADSVVALQAKTGKELWGFQLVHHDLWDYDTASPPLLATLRRNGREIPVVIQGNKTGNLFVLNRDTGAPVFPVKERSVPQSRVPGEVTSPTQPFPLEPPPLAQQHMTPEQAYGVTPADRKACKRALKKLRTGGIFTPPSLQGTLAIPGSAGGMNWGGYAFDPQDQTLFVNVTNLPYIVKLIPRDKFRVAEKTGQQGEYTPQAGTPYGMYRNPLFSPSGLPCSPPPWGRMIAVNMTNGRVRWQVPLGSMATFSPKCAMCHGGAGGNMAPPSGSMSETDSHHPSKPLGSISLGGPIVTAGGLVFIAGTTDGYLRAFDVGTGSELWKAKLPTAAFATPMTYQLPKGKQYLVIAAGGHAKIQQNRLDDALVAFALP
jgi:membrane-bound PQQ-dependent dehydrogenase (glucose/quinate/shikimate family)